MTSKFIPGGDRNQQLKAQMEQQKQPDLSLAQDVVCENCANFTFEEVLLMKKVSALISPNGKDGIVPIPTFACVACGFVNQMFRPAYMRNETPEAPVEQETPKSSLILEK